MSCGSAIIDTTRKGHRMIYYKATYYNKAIDHTAVIKGKARSLESAREAEQDFIDRRNQNGGDFVLVSVVRA